MAQKKRDPFYIPTDQLVLLVERMQRYESEAFEEFYRAFHDKIRGHLVVKAEIYSVADKLVDEVFSEIFRSIHKLRKPEAVVSWVNLITDHQVAAYFRKLRKEQKMQMEKKQELKSALKQESNQQETEEDIVLTPEIVRQLPKKQAEVMLLHYSNHVAVKEIAKILNVPEGTVKSRLYYGRKKLKEILTAEKRNVN